MVGKCVNFESALTGGQYELPGLWFSLAEIHALLTMQHLLANLDPGSILTPHIQPLMARLNALLGTAENTAEEICRRVLVVGVGQRQIQLDHFERVGSALLRRRQLHITYLCKVKSRLAQLTVDIASPFSSRLPTQCLHEIFRDVANSAEPA